jgi:hypothetical protein
MLGGDGSDFKDRDVKLCTLGLRGRYLSIVGRRRVGFNETICFYDYLEYGT